MAQMEGINPNITRRGSNSFEVPEELEQDLAQLSDNEDPTAIISAGFGMGVDIDIVAKGFKSQPSKHQGNKRLKSTLELRSTRGRGRARARGGARASSQPIARRLPLLDELELEGEDKGEEEDEGEDESVKG
ncbi:hypothetical protein CJ030_MR8G005843 [Morella rubra]|uniref:Uncharacterized protein n=1 Tax=Morella rubra TaxID=262757 RepID=A0A6A1US85_9ROSI|nr:hypothetical protein CJ030_MR8G005843 [Morella rubra]